MVLRTISKTLQRKQDECRRWRYFLIIISTLSIPVLMRSTDRAYVNMGGMPASMRFSFTSTYRNGWSYPGLAPELTDLVEHNSYCGPEGFGEIICRQPVAEEIRSRRKRVDVLMEANPPDKPLRRILRLAIRRTSWTFPIFARLNESTCKFPIIVVPENDSRDWDLKIDTEGSSKHDLVLDFETFFHGGTDNDVVIGFHKYADIWTSYWPGDYGRQCGFTPSCLFHPWAYVDKEYALELRSQRTALGAVFISDCHENYARERMYFLEEFAQHIPLDSYGACTPPHTMQTDEKSIDLSRLLPGIQNPTKYQKKVAIAATYNFSFALENSIREDYITEKLFHALQGGNVMIVFGATNIDEFRPADLAWVNALHFKHPKYLAEYIHLLNSRKDLYDKYMAHRFLEDVQNPKYMELQRRSLEAGETSVLCTTSEFYNRRFGDD